LQAAAVTPGHFRLVAMRDYIRRGTARPLFITSLSFLTVQGACLTGTPIEFGYFNISPSRIAKNPSAKAQIEKSFRECAYQSR
jgi:hypothetical protein